MVYFSWLLWRCIQSIFIGWKIIFTVFISYAMHMLYILCTYRICLHKSIAYSVYWQIFDLKFFHPTDSPGLVIGFRERFLFLTYFYGVIQVCNWLLGIGSRSEGLVFQELTFLGLATDSKELSTPGTHDSLMSSTARIFTFL